MTSCLPQLLQNFSCALTPERQEALTELIENVDNMSYNVSRSSDTFRRRYQNNLDGTFRNYQFIYNGQVIDLS